MRGVKIRIFVHVPVSLDRIFQFKLFTRDLRVGCCGFCDRRVFRGHRFDWVARGRRGWRCIGYCGTLVVCFIDNVASTRYLLLSLPRRRPPNEKSLTCGKKRIRQIRLRPIGLSLIDGL
jgi:hypothetical protein